MELFITILILILTIEGIIVAGIAIDFLFNEIIHENRKRKEEQINDTKTAS